MRVKATPVESNPIAATKKSELSFMQRLSALSNVKFTQLEQDGLASSGD